MLADPTEADFLTENMRQKLALLMGDPSADASQILASEERFLKAAAKRRAAR
jgi:hypothetical protein